MILSETNCYISTRYTYDLPRLELPSSECSQHKSFHTLLDSYDQTGQWRGMSPVLAGEGTHLAPAPAWNRMGFEFVLHLDYLDLRMSDDFLGS
jgi:hypothetical protein